MLQFFSSKSQRSCSLNHYLWKITWNRRRRIFIIEESCRPHKQQLKTCHIFREIIIVTLSTESHYRCIFLSSRFFSSKFFHFWCPKIWNIENYWLLKLLKLILWHKRTSWTLKSIKLILESKISNFEAPKMEEFGRENPTT